MDSLELDMGICGSEQGLGLRLGRVEIALELVHANVHRLAAISKIQSKMMLFFRYIERFSGAGTGTAFVVKTLQNRCTLTDRCIPYRVINLYK